MIFLQIPLGGRSLEEHALSFLRGSDKVELVREFTAEGRKGIQKKAVDYIQKQVSAERAVAQQNDSKSNENFTPPLQKMLSPIISQYMKEFMSGMEDLEEAHKTVLDSTEEDSE